MRLARLLAVAALAAATIGVTAPASGAAGLTEVTGFGSNPGNIRMFTYVPTGLAAGRPLVVVLHGCTLTAADADDESGWTKWADQNSFALLLPQQQSANNGSVCWNSFLPSDQQRGGGEPLSIKQQVDWMIANHGVDTSKVFVTGLSAGGAMTSVMLATYPEVFAAGAVVGGTPYKCASTVGASLKCNSGMITKTPVQWGNLVRGASSWTGPWPRVSLWHGSADMTVAYSNLNEMVEQWTDVHGIDQTADTSDALGGYPRKVHRDTSGTARVEAITLTGQDHGQPVDPGPGAAQCGTAVAYNLDMNICASYHIASWFGI